MFLGFFLISSFMLYIYNFLFIELWHNLINIFHMNEPNEKKTTTTMREVQFRVYWFKFFRRKRCCLLHMEHKTFQDKNKISKKSIRTQILLDDHSIFLMFNIRKILLLFFLPYDINIKVENCFLSWRKEIEGITNMKRLKMRLT